MSLLLGNQGGGTPTVLEAGTAADAVDASQLGYAALNEAGTALDPNDATQLAYALTAEAGSTADIEDAAITTPQLEVGSAADVGSATVTTAPVIAEAGTAADANTASYIGKPAITEAGSALDVTASTYKTPSAGTEAGTAADTETAAYSTPAASANAGTAADTETNYLGSTQLMTEAGSAADTEAATEIGLVVVIEAGSAADAEDSAQISTVMEAEAGSATDGEDATFTFAVADIELGSAADTVSGLQTANGVAPEAGTAVDASATAQTWTGAESETAGVWSAASISNAAMSSTFTGINYSAAFSRSVLCVVTPAYAPHSTGGYAASSTDGGSTWTYTAMPSSGNWNCVAWNGSVFCSINAANGHTATSPDGVAWAEHTPSAAASLISNSNIIWFAAAGLFCAPYNAMTSPDGITWTSHGTGIPNYPYAGVQNMAANSTTLVAINSYGTNHSYTTTDGATWTLRGALPFTDTALGIAWNAGAGLFCVVDATSTTAGISPDGVAWTTITLPYASGGTITSDGLLFVEGNCRQFSADGVNWQSAVSVGGSNIVRTVTALGSGRFVAVFTGTTAGASVSRLIAQLSNSVADAVSSASLVNITESGSATDTDNAVAAATMLETGTAGDGESAIQNENATASEAGAAVDNDDAAQTGSAHGVESGTAADSEISVLLAQVTGIETGSANDAESSALHAVVLTTESSSAIDFNYLGMAAFITENAMTYAPVSVQGTMPVVYAAGTTTPITAVNWASIAWIVDRYFAVYTDASGLSVNYATSRDGYTWIVEGSSSYAGSWGYVAGCGSTKFAGSAAPTYPASNYYLNNWSLRTDAPNTNPWSPSVWFAGMLCFPESARALHPTAGWFTTSGVTGTWAVAASSSKAVALSTITQGAFSISTDGINWTYHTGMPSRWWDSIAWNTAAGVFCATSSGTTYAATSPDGLTWTARTLPCDAGLIVSDGSWFVSVASGSTSAAFSADGVTWTAFMLPVSAPWASAATDGAGTIVLLAGGASTSNVSLRVRVTPSVFDHDDVTLIAEVDADETFPQLVGFTPYISVSGWSGYLTRAVNNGQITVATGYGVSQICYTLDGISWAGGSTMPTGYYIDVNSRAVFIGSTWLFSTEGGIVKSNDGMVWAAITLPSVFVGTTWGQKLSANDSQFIIMSYVDGSTATHTSTSADGVTWTTPAALPVLNSFDTLRWSGLHWFASWGGDSNVYARLNNNIVSSPDGVTWTLAVFAAISGAYPGTVFTAMHIGTVTVVLTDIGLYHSADGVNFGSCGLAPLASRTADDIHFNVACNGSVFMAVLGDVYTTVSTVYLSADGVTWTPVTIPTIVYFSRCISRGRYLVLFGRYIGVYSTDNGATWTTFDTTLSGSDTFFSNGTNEPIYPVWMNELTAIWYPNVMSTAISARMSLGISDEPAFYPTFGVAIHESDTAADSSSTSVQRYPVFEYEPCLVRGDCDAVQRNSAGVIGNGHAECYLMGPALNRFVPYYPYYVPYV